MLKIGVTGNIGSGKSEVEKILNELGYNTICADKIVHGLYLNKEVQKEIEEEFSTLNREEIAKIVFTNSEKKAALEKILHPRVIKKIEDFFRQNNGGFAIVPLLYEAHLEEMFDKVIFIAADENVRLGRILKRSAENAHIVRAKIQSQMPQEEKIKRADFVIQNNSSLKELKINLEKCLDNLF